MKKSEQSVLDIYMNYVFKILIIAVPVIALIAGATFTGIKVLGYYEEVSWATLIILDLLCCSYFLLGIWFSRHCEDKNGILNPQIVFWGKVFISFMEIAQWNSISYIIPSRDFWGYGVFFVLLSVFFLDSKFVLFTISEISVSIALSWMIRGEDLLPLANDNFIPNLILRCVLLVLSFAGLWSLSYLMETRFVAELERIADYDTLTLLFNRRTLSQFLQRTMEKAKKNNTVFSVLMCDLDDFKKVNDSYGHRCGDRVLKEVADRVLRSVAGEGTTFRYGGEEFLVLLEGSEAYALTVAERIRSRIAQEDILCEEKSISMTVTIGVSTYDEKVTDAEQLIQRADVNLYYGKNHGKNQVVN